MGEIDKDKNESLSTTSEDRVWLITDQRLQELKAARRLNRWMMLGILILIFLGGLVVGFMIRGAL